MVTSLETTCLISLGENLYFDQHSTVFSPKIPINIKPALVQNMCLSVGLPICVNPDRVNQIELDFATNEFMKRYLQFYIEHIGLWMV